jgi:hypothetical protein
MKCAAILFALLTTSQAGAQILGGYDPFGWSRESNEQGLEEACKAYQNQYHTIVALHNASRNQRDRESYREHLREIEKQIDRYCR